MHALYFVIYEFINLMLTYTNVYIQRIKCERIIKIYKDKNVTKLNN